MNYPKPALLSRKVELDSAPKYITIPQYNYKLQVQKPTIFNETGAWESFKRLDWKAKILVILIFTIAPIIYLHVKDIQRRRR